MQIRRRRNIVDPITAAYDQILATDPTVPLLFRLTEYRGQQILFQDSACTVPVESIGDPVGGVRHPETGEILAVQTADANRPIWGGVDVGLVFDGVGSWLSLSNEWKRNPSAPSTWIYREIHPSDRNQVIASWSTAANTDVAYAWYYRTSSGLIMRVGTGGTLLAEGVISHDQKNTLSVRNDTSEYTTRVNGSDVQTRTTGTSIGDPLVPAALGSLEGSAQFFEGNIEAALIYDESLSVPQLQNLEALL